MPRPYEPAARRTRFVAVATSVVVAFAATVLTATPANAATPPPPAENRLGGFTHLEFDPADPYKLDRFRTAGGFPGQTVEDGLRVLGMRDGVQYQLTINKSVYTGADFDSPDGPIGVMPLFGRWASLYASGGPFTTELPVGGEFTVYVEALPGGAAGPTDPPDTVAISDSADYYSQTFVRTATGIEAKDGGSTPEKTATNTTLAASGTTASSTTLTATVDKPAATGKVKFSKDGAEIGQADVANGVATLGASGLAGDTEYSFTAEYLGDATHESSTSPSITVKTLTSGPPADVDDTEIGVTVPEAGGPTSLRITVTPGGVTLDGGERDAGEIWTATGELPEVTVTDDRQNAAASDWSLNGSATKFTSAAGEFASSNLAWAPQHVSGPGVAGGSANDLSQPRNLATGDASATPAVVTKVKAGLTLKVPSDAAAGAYTSKLTLTLI